MHAPHARGHGGNRSGHSLSYETLGDKVQNIWFVLVPSPGGSISSPTNIRIFSSQPVSSSLKIPLEPRLVY